MTKQIFLFGFPRSGTTLIRSRISQHPDIHLINEPEIIYGLRNAGYNTNDKLKITRELLNRLGEISHCRNHLDKLDDNYVDSLCQNDELISFKKVYEKLLPIPQNIKIWGEKSLNNCYFLKELSQLYPESLFINIIRDPRSCILSKYNKSQMKNKKSKDKNIESQKKIPLNNAVFFAKHAAFWSAWYSATDREISKNIPPKKILNLKYEDFINNPKLHLKTICEKLGISFDEKMIDYDDNQQDSVLSSKSAYAHQNISKKIDGSKAYSYLEMSPAMILAVEHFAGEQMKKYGYSVNKPKLPIIDHFLQKLLLKKNAKSIGDYVNIKLQNRAVDSI